MEKNFHLGKLFIKIRRLIYDGRYDADVLPARFAGKDAWQMVNGCDRQMPKMQEERDTQSNRRRERVYFILAILLPVLALLSGAAAAAHRYGLF